ncbi:cysteine/serine endopeptidase inhibitor [Streptantibioticus cattleyicolor]|uniref:RlpA-like protein double-psi beta-barrel domain-containing protein n=1 Tax=Streptantibioticus cattleyicolor (strain ATCC 35852 / DSM 46488 / JCM 4925 / NBRC 14057 / NRRL 8057) TaxID=1003195 RepID=F8JME3_STREN|nr:cysteine/serine endopeptidase inhibitor [Streptantibioticus cattleyicolor]AEW99378.1 hypothetical protein SCATT_p11850 [Streptantibioticus cattleyicolor NRRL 8057 = DSM 46488]CCB71581.1 conserved exported protein of unknown function [Streptantibioticus cattleyicolor NRRL 8057 = DSM 46488]
MHALKRLGPPVGVALGAAALAVLTAGPAFAGIPFGQPMSGRATWYDDAGYSACGTPIDASTQPIVAVGPSWWTSANPNNDPLCGGVSVKVTYNGTTITVPIRDKCFSCDAGHIDLSVPAFRQLADLGVGTINVTWQFVQG